MLIGGCKSAPADQRLVGISELLAYFQLPAVKHSLLLAFLSVVASVCTVAQDRTGSSLSPDFAVLDYADSSVATLNAKQFAELADKNPQTTPIPNEPLSVVIVLDATSGMAATIDDVRGAIGELIRASNAREMALVVIHDQPQVVVHLAGSGGTIQQAAETIQAEGFGTMWDGMYLGMGELQNSHCPRKAMIVISDDGDKYGRHSPSELRSLLKNADVEVYAIGTFDRYANRFQARMRALQLEEIISTTGGRVLPSNDLSPAVAQIASDLRRPIHRHALMAVKR